MKHFLQKTWLMLLCLLAGVGTTWAAVDATLIFSEQGYTNAQKVSSGTIDSYTSWSATDGSYSTAYYDTGSGLRVYSGGAFTITSTQTIASITLTFSGTGYTFSDSNTTNPQTVNPNATSYTWDVSRICRLQKIEVTYAAGGTPVAGPTNLSAGTPTSTGTTLSWDAVDHATAYKVEYKVSGDASWTTVTPNPITPSCTISGLSPNTTYAWQVTALSTETGYTNGPTQAGTNFTTTAPVCHKAYFYVNGTSLNVDGTSFFEGDAISFPTDPAVDGVVFMGWATESIDGTQDHAPTFVNTTTETMGTSDVDYYAVFATLEGRDTETWNQVTSLNDIKAGTYVIINGGFYLASTSTGSSTAPSANTAPDIAGGKITGTVTDDMIWYLTSTGADNQFYVKNTDGKFLYATNANNGLRVNTTTDKWTFDIHTTGYFSMKEANNSRYCAKYSEGNDWRSYNSKDATYYANNGKLELYKLTKNTTYSNYCTTVSTKTTPSLSFEQTTYYATLEEEFTAPTLSKPEDIAVTYSSSNTAIAEVNENSGAITLKGKGQTTITASYDGSESDKYNSCSTSYELIVAVKHTAKFSVNGVIDESQNCTVAEGLNITFPADPESQYGLTFMGWSSEKIVGVADAPDMINVDAEVMGTKDVTYYAVFAKPSGSSLDYQLVESALDNWTGDYLIVYNNTYAMNTHYGNQNTNTYATYTDIREYYTEATKSIASNTATDALVYRATPTTNGYSLYCVSDESYLGITANTTDTGARLRWNTSYTESTDDWTLGVGAIGNVGSKTLYIRWYNTYSSYRFAAYGSNAQQAIQLFKKQETTYTDYCTSFITFDEANNSVEDVSGIYGRVVVNRTIKGGTDGNYGVWNTFCVPFDMNEEQINANLGEDAEVKELNGMNVNGTNFNMHFGDAVDGDENKCIEAGKPYMIRVKSTVNTIIVANAEGVAVNTTTAPSASVDDDQGNSITFHGNYAKQFAGVGSFIISSNKFYYVDADAENSVTLKGFRGYITTETSGGSQVRALTFSFDDLITGISTNLEADQDLRIYNLQGLQQSKLQRGVNIVGGRKVIK